MGIFVKHFALTFIQFNSMARTFPNCSGTRIMRSVFNNPNKTSTFYGLLNVRGLTSICVTSLPVISNSHHNIRKICSCFGVPPFSVFPFYRSCSSSLRFSVMSQNDDHKDSIKTVRCAIKGRVQGVFYRNWTIENATQLGLKGWVRNRRDGSVEALFSGNSEAVDEMMQRCRRGPPDAMVTAFQAHPCDEDAGDSFERRPTV
ncbi:uncharacterized protein LOC141648217 [Silene latifolia]|uniref:uncharacterized protein LOC141648217 n=1 Tax=Silene latifolia TaxID=37657 RepID=UPI003D779070